MSVGTAFWRAIMFEPRVKLVGFVALPLILSTPPVMSAALEEVIVTAQKREQSLQDVPLAVSVVTSEQLVDNNINNIEDLTKIVPSLRIGGGTSPDSLRIRGVGTDVFSVAVEPNVSVVVDGVPLARNSLASFQFNDIERIEVLRGPQGTLFGKNSSAGLVQIITQDPSDEVQTRFSANYEAPQHFSGDQQIYQFSTSGPFSDALGARLTGYVKDLDGHIEDTEQGQDLGDVQEYGLRGKLRWDASETLTARLAMEYAERDAEPYSIVYASASPELQARDPGTEFGSGNRQSRSFGGNKDNPENAGTQLTVDWTVNDFTLTSISSYRDAKQPGSLGISNLAGDSVDSVQTADVKIRTTTQELRVSSPQSESFEYTLGTLYFENKVDRGFDRLSTDYPLSLAAGTPSFPGEPTVMNHEYMESYVNTRNIGIFAHSIWHFTDRWHLTTGVRYINEQLDTAFTTFSTASLESSGTVLRDARFTAPRTSIQDKAPIGTLSLQYDWGEHSILYSTLSSGYRGGAFNIVEGADEEAIEQPVKPEKSKSVEVGIKSRLFDGQLELEADVFLSRFRNFQAQVLDLTGGISTDFRLANAGELESRGVELDFRARPMDSVIIYGSLLYNKAEFNDFDAQCFVGQLPGEAGGVDIDGDGSCDYQDAAGGTLPNAPEWSGSLTTRYDHPLDNSSNIYGQLSGRWQSEVQFNTEQHPLTKQDGYAILDLRVGWQSASQAFEVAAYVNNLLEKHYVVAKIPLSLTNDRRDVLHGLPVSADRVFGMLITWNF
jgi:iron complex outermembrane receptor protein